MAHCVSSPAHRVTTGWDVRRCVSATTHSRRNVILSPVLVTANLDIWGTDVRKHAPRATTVKCVPRLVWDAMLATLKLVNATANWDKVVSIVVKVAQLVRLAHNVRSLADAKTVHTVVLIPANVIALLDSTGPLVPREMKWADDVK